MSFEAETIVIGSGPSGIIAATRLLEGGQQVLLIDAGLPEDRFPIEIPERAFVALRQEDPQQHRYLLGEAYEGIALGVTGPLAQATPPRHGVFRRAAILLPTSSDGFMAIESLAAGGLGEAWGAVAFPFTPREAQRAGLDSAELAASYDTVARLVGISGAEDDDLVPWRGALAPLQPAPAPDPNGAALLRRYGMLRNRFVPSGFRLGRPLLALLTRQLGARQADSGYGLDFWNNVGQSVFRPSVQLDVLRSHPRLCYRPGLLVLRFREEAEGGPVVESRALTTGQRVSLRARCVVLAAGALGTARIVLRSLNGYDQPVPLACNRHVLLPAVRWGGIGSAPPESAHALAQLTAMYDPTGDQEHLVQAQFYSFTGLPLARLLREARLPYRESIRILRALATSFVTLVIQHEDVPGPAKTCRLVRGASPEQDVLEVGYRPPPEETRRQHRAERVFFRVLRRLGCWPLRLISPGAGSSVHYGATLPFSQQPQPLTTAPSGRLWGTRAVYIADGSTFRYLPAKGLTLTLMANAHRVASGIAKIPGSVRVG